MAPCRRISEITIFAAFLKPFILRKLAALFLLFTCAFSGYGQYSEIGVFGGGTNFIGDVGNYGIHLPRGYVSGLVFRNQFNNYWSVRAHFKYGTLQNDDAISTLPYRRQRNLNFGTDIWEGGILFEFNFFEFETGSRMNHSPYIFAGVAMFRFNPTTTFDGNIIELQPLGTEGQGTLLSSRAPYGLNAFAIPFGIGYRFTLNDVMGLSLECGFRRASTDYLDDVSGNYVNVAALSEEKGELAALLSDRSVAGYENAGRPRGNGQKRDWYVFSGVTLFFKLTSRREKCLKVW
jgi:hypothetical protein